jgi:hypothetical protein
MPGNNEEASIPMEDERNGERMNVRRKFANMLKYFNPFSTMPPPQDEDAPAAKRPRLQASTSISNAEDADTVVDAHTTDNISSSPSQHTVAVAPTDAVAVTVAATSLPSSQASRAYTPRRKWNLEEDAKLTEAVNELGNDWVIVAAMVPGRTKKQCRYGWAKDLDPAIKTGRWIAEEDAKLIEGLQKHGKKWVAVAAMVPGRTNRQCRSRWVESLDPAINTGRWIAEEDTMLTDAIKEHGNNWTAVAALVPGRTKMHCYGRWRNYLDPTIDQKTTRMDNKGKWTLEEDAKLGDAVKELGTNWAAVTAMVPGRTNKQCRYRWARGSEEDVKLTEALKDLG